MNLKHQKLMTTTLISNLHEYLAQDLSSINEVILSYIIPEEKLINDISSHLIAAGGKKIRPIIHLICARGFGAIDYRSIHLATAVEFIHAATLLHDDVIDESNTRRGHKTANFLWGNKASILVGDFLFSQAFKLMVSARSIECLELLSSAAAIIAEGEVMQLKNIGHILTKDQYYRIISAKTAELFSASAASGASIANQPENIVRKLQLFGMNLGLIFQIRDDFLDYFGDSEIMGKQKGQDFLESKSTLPLILTYIKQPKIIDLYNNPQNNFDNLVSIMLDLKIEIEIEKEIDLLYNDSIEILESIEMKTEEKRFLHEILEFAKNRIK